MAIQFRRRELIAALGGMAATWPLAARAQQAMPVIGFLNSAFAQGYARPLSAFLKGLSETGYVERQNVAIEYRWAEGHNDRLSAMMADLVHRQVAVIAATTTAAALAARAATTTIPIVFETGDDPVRLGLVASLNRPGGNVTGITQSNVEEIPKLVQLLHELIPSAHVIALLINSANSTLAEANARLAQAAAKTMGLELHLLNASSERDFDDIFEKLTQLQAGGLVIGGDPLFTSHSEQLAALAASHAVPAVYKGREFAVAGGLLSYGGDVSESYRLTGIYTGRVLKGDKPANLPVQQATKVELFLNLNTAKGLGITVPLPLSGRADELFE
jgi:putative ABC transport system substrate-binding protein